MGAVFRPEAEREFEDVDNRGYGAGTAFIIDHWEPTGEPDVPFEQLQEHAF